MFVLLCVPALGLAVPAQAGHFRYGDIAWRVVQPDVTGRAIEFKVNAGWCLGNANAIGLNFGDGTSGNANIVYANINNAYGYGTGTVQHRYNANDNFTVSYSGNNGKVLVCHNGHATCIRERNGRHGLFAHAQQRKPGYRSLPVPPRNQRNGKTQTPRLTTAR